MMMFSWFEEYNILVLFCLKHLRQIYGENNWHTDPNVGGANRIFKLSLFTNVLNGLVICFSFDTCKKQMEIVIDFMKEYNTNENIIVEVQDNADNASIFQNISEHRLTVSVLSEVTRSLVCAPSGVLEWFSRSASVADTGPTVGPSTLFSLKFRHEYTRIIWYTKVQM